MNPDGSPFTLANFPFGVADGRVHLAVGDQAVDVAAAARAGLVDVDPAIVEIVRPSGQVLVDGAPALAPSAQLDIELELGAIVGVGNQPGEPIPVREADAHLFGFSWSTTGRLGTSRPGSTSPSARSWASRSPPPSRR